MSVYTEKNYYLLNNNYFCTPVFFSVWGGGLYEGSLLLAVLRTSTHARGISNITVGQRRNMCYCQLELGVMGRWNNRLPWAIGGTTVPVSGVRLIPLLATGRTCINGITGVPTLDTVQGKCNSHNRNTRSRMGLQCYSIYLVSFSNLVFRLSALWYFSIHHHKTLLQGLVQVCCGCQLLLGDVL